MNAILDRLRAAGWSVAIHNDYRLNGKANTFYLLTHDAGVWIKGEGATDEAALLQAEIQASARLPLVRPCSGASGDQEEG